MLEDAEREHRFERVVFERQGHRLGGVQRVELGKELERPAFNAHCLRHVVVRHHVNVAVDEQAGDLPEATAPVEHLPVPTHRHDVGDSPVLLHLGRGENVDMERPVRRHGGSG